MANRDYYSFVTREKKKVSRSYLGPKHDPVVSLVMRQDKLFKAYVAADKYAAQVELKTISDIETTLQQFVAQRKKLEKIWLQSQGLRVIRAGKVTAIKRPSKGDYLMTQQLTKDDVEELVARCENGDADALKELRTHMWENRETWQPFGDLSDLVRRQFFSLLARGNVIATESLRMNFAELANRLKGEAKTAIERLVVDEVLMCYLDYHYHQIVLNGVNQDAKEIDRLEKRLTNAQKRYHAAMDALDRLTDIELHETN